MINIKTENGSIKLGAPYIGGNDSIDNYIEIDAPVKEED